MQKFVDSLVFDFSSFIILDKGRVRNEKSIVLMENGVFKGYGYLPYPIFKQDKSKWLEYIETLKEDRDTKSIINGYLRKKKNFKRIDL